MSMKVFIVMNEKQNEGVLFDDYNDAQYAATGEYFGAELGVSSLAESFRELYAEDEDIFQVKEIEI